jgi:hypothetical protein
LFKITTAGKPDPQPLYVANLAIPSQGTHNTLFVEDEEDFAYAFDADTGEQLWQTNTLAFFPGEVPSDDHGVLSVSPVIGITATPVIDLTKGPHGTIYMITYSKDTSDNYHHRLHALDITTGAEQFGGPIEIAATYPGSGPNAVNGKLVFGAASLKEQAALTLVKGMVLTTWSAHNDKPPYNSWLIGYDAATLGQTQVLNLTPNGVRGSIWMARGGPNVDANGAIYLMVANGTFDNTIVNGFPAKNDYGMCLVRLEIANGQLQIADFFAMSNILSEDNEDLDLGSSSPMLLQPMTDSNGIVRHLIVGAGKDQNIYIADTANLGGFHNPDQIYQELLSQPLAGRSFASPVAFNSFLYYAAVRDVIRVYRFKQARLSTTPVATSATALQFQGANLVISSNGSSDAILWALENEQTHQVLHAYDAVHFNNGKLVELYNSDQAPNNNDHFGPGNHFVTPLVMNGKVYAASATGIGVFGLLK